MASISKRIIELKEEIKKEMLEKEIVSVLILFE